MKRLRFPLASGLNVEFTDRELAIKRVEDWATHGMSVVHVVYGPEGCGKSTWLRQSTELLRELGFEVTYINPLHQQFIAYTDMKDLIKQLTEATVEAFGTAQVRLATLALEFAKEALRRRKRKVAVMIDDAFKVVGIDKAAMYVKGLLGLIEYPPADYDIIITVVATSEDLSRREIGRHRWAYLDAMWNMPKGGFMQLYEQIPGEKPDFEEAWRLTGGNPKLLGQLYEVEWNVEAILRRIIDDKRLKALASSLSPEERRWLKDAVEDPDTLLVRERIPLMDKLVELNLIIDTIPERSLNLWIDTPPPEKDLEIGVGKDNTWQTPLHREAVRRVLGA
ncbi:ATP-binding protein [Caldivirga sp. UBA161]|uniref:ATP-binding protein n=1 Tax=Caldivirga sp. UBA161 TaxID=1915569 RepID=UPI0025BA414D|nr:ATP-binding protein [Caldivirga sp. UBA161]